MLRLRSENGSDGRTWHPSGANAREPAMWEVKLRNAGGWTTAGALAARAATARVTAQSHWQKPLEARDAVRAIVVARRVCQDEGMHANSFGIESPEYHRSHNAVSTGWFGARPVTASQSAATGCTMEKQRFSPRNASLHSMFKQLEASSDLRKP
jgi:hypothetical protein